MSKRGPTKAQSILTEAKNRVLIAEADVHSAHEALRVAEAVLSAQQDTYNALEKSLERQRPKSSSSAQGASGRSSSKKLPAQSPAPSTETDGADALSAAKASAGGD